MSTSLKMAPKPWSTRLDSNVLCKCLLMTFLLHFCMQCRRPGFSPWVGKIPWRREWQPTPVFLPGESRGQRSLADYGPQGCKELDTTEQQTLSISTEFYSLNSCYPHISLVIQPVWSSPIFIISYIIIFRYLDLRECFHT